MKGVKLEILFYFGQVVYLKQDPNQEARVVTDIEFNGGPENPRYHLQSSGFTTPHYAFEISDHVDLLARFESQ